MLVRRNKRPEDMSGLMASFFANMLPEMALIWALSLCLFYRRIYIDYFSVPDYKIHVLPAWIIFGITCVFVLFPVRTIIKKCYEDKTVDTGKPYEEVCSEFVSDYDTQNPVTKRAALVRLIDKRIHHETDAEKKEKLIQDKMRMALATPAMAFANYAGQKQEARQSLYRQTTT